MDTMNAIRNRKSFRGPFTDTPVSREDLTELLEAGYLAPSGCNLQTTRLIGVDDPELLAGLADIYSHEWAKGATAAILLIGSYTMSPSGVSYHVHDYCAWNGVDRRTDPRRKGRKDGQITGRAGGSDRLHLHAGRLSRKARPGRQKETV